MCLMIKWNIYNYKSLSVFSHVFHNLKYPLFSATDVLNALVIVNVTNLKPKSPLRKRNSFVNLAIILRLFGENYWAW